MTFELKQIRPVASKTKAFIASTKQSRAICNDPFVSGLQYTDYLSEACRQVLVEMQAKNLLSLKEDETTVLNVLRGGLNFGLREALAKAYNWNNHSSAFISAQRARKEPHSEEWIITESSYKKIYLKPSSSIVFGDVVATGTSLKYALERMVNSAKEMGSQIKELVFFTIGGPNSFSIVSEVAEQCQKLFPSFIGATVIYFEGEFLMATKDTPVSIKIDGTDLLRRDCLMADAFIQSQYEKPTYPLERCTIYDAGSWSFDVAEYWFDVREYWEEVLGLARKGMTFEQLVKERCPAIDTNKYGNVDLQKLCTDHIASFPASDRSRGHVPEVLVSNG